MSLTTDLQEKGCSNSILNENGASPTTTTIERPPRTSADFLRFCDIVLAYENYIASTMTELLEKTESTGSSSGEEELKRSKAPKRTDVTCYCGKPCGRRQLIGCHNCLIWVHRQCAKMPKTSSKTFICPKCRVQMAFSHNPEQGLWSVVFMKQNDRSVAQTIIFILK